MTKKTVQLLFFTVFAIGLSALLFFVFKPYLGVVFFSGVLAIVFYPVYEKLVDKFGKRKNLAAFTTTCLILAFIIIPAAILSALLLREAINLYNLITLGGGSENIISQINVLFIKVSDLLPAAIAGPEINLELYARDILNWIIGNFDSIFAAIFGGILNFILMLISLHYLLIFGDKIKNGLVAWSPLLDEHDEKFIQALRSTVDAVLRGRILVSIVQGVFIGAGFAIFGIGSPVLWGFLGGLASLIPIVGTSIITIPAVAYLFLSGNFGAGLGLLIWGAIIVGLIDNVISIAFLKGKIEVHPLIILFSILGGVELFGAIGFLVGPVIVSAFVALMKVYPFIAFIKTDRRTDS